jgi:transcriptional regulator with XRE-family HTH domain
MTTGQLIKQARTTKKLTQAQLAERSRLERTKLCRIEQDKIDPRLGELADIAAALGISAKRLVGISE